MLAHAPIQRQFAARHLATIADQVFHQRVRLETLRNGRDALAQALEFGQRQSGIGGVGPFFVEEWQPVHRVLALEVRQHVFDRGFALVHQVTEVLDHLLRLAGLEYSLRHQFVAIQLAGAGMLGDALVHQRLRQRRRVLFVVAELAEADDVDHDVLGEFRPVVDRDLGREHHRLGVVAVDMQHRRLDHLDHVGAIQGRARIARVGGGEADLVVDHQMHGAVGAIAARLRQVEGLHHHPLAGERRVAMHQDRQHLRAVLVAAAVHARLA